MANGTGIRRADTTWKRNGKPLAWSAREPKRPLVRQLVVEWEEEVVEV